MENKKVYRSFDAIKGIVILITVIIGHYWQFTPGGYYANGVNQTWVEITNKITAFSFSKTLSFMELLLMISGFQLYASYNKIQNRETEFGAYLKKRVIRLYPVAILAAVCMFIGVYAHYYQVGEYWYNTSPAPAHFLENMTLIQTWVNNAHTLNGPMWYVSVYFFCTILYFMLARIDRKHGGIYWMFVPVIAGLWLTEKKSSIILLNADMARGYIAFFFGVLVAVFSEKLSKTKAYIYSVSSIAVFIIFYNVFQGFINIGTALDKTLPFMVLLYAPMLVLLSHCPVLDRIIGNPLLRGLGKISYCMAAFNFPFYVWLAVLDNKFKWNLPYGRTYMYYVIAGAQILLAAIIYLAFEKPVSGLLSGKTKRKKAEKEAA